MKILCTDDWHIRGTTPENRIDDFPETLHNKIKDIFKIAYDNGCELVVIAGDVFDSSTIPYQVTQKYIRLFLEWSNFFHIAVVPGQHDLRWHSKDVENIPLACLHAAGAVILLSKAIPFRMGKFVLYGAGWNEEIVTPAVYSDQFNILVTHRMVVHDKLWSGQEGEERANILLMQNQGYDLIVSGDNHQTVIGTYGKSMLINAGAIGRTKSDQVNHTPIVVIYDTDTRQYEVVPIPCQPIEVVMDLNKVALKKQRKEEMGVFTKSLQQELSRHFTADDKSEVAFDYVREIWDTAKEHELDTELQEMIFEMIMED